ncbi:LysR family transcriptional regulator [Aestuariicella hydrocarbonica]|uniref:LysR family transcriptional regulator n=1 Tax=Pseudomaricurvus hydrocarbonicus TaxID=1470433 RepID=A0A9E5T2F0_9GAMM|nr:LysR family transcriptional regulator [Aestuariicella hydrocarbonica]NHO67771.1 LysR family transcriptional regulator [Aestuariicella hydrocarbonica]
MDIRQLDRIDLNLLVTFQALLEERNVSRAAERLFLTQSAMSKSLGRLRELFDDRLFTRSAAGMVPTPRALDVAAHLPNLLGELQQLIQPSDFDPLSYEGEFALIVPEFIGFWLLPELMARLAKTAPGMRLKSVSRAEHQLELLASGELDFAIQVEQHIYPPEVELTSLGHASPVLFARQGHPLEGKELTWDMVSDYPHMQLFIPDLKEALFVARGDSAFIRHEAVVPPHFETGHLFTALQVLKRTDYLMPGPPVFVEDSTLSSGIVSLPLPDGEKLKVQYVLAQHVRVKNSAAHQFLRQTLVEVVDYFVAQRLQSKAQPA